MAGHRKHNESVGDGDKEVRALPLVAGRRL
jgi:hypothetical protein